VECRFLFRFSLSFSLTHSVDFDFGSFLPPICDISQTMILAIDLHDDDCILRIFPFFFYYFEFSLPHQTVLFYTSFTTYGDSFFLFSLVLYLFSDSWIRCMDTRDSYMDDGNARDVDVYDVDNCCTDVDTSMSQACEWVRGRMIGSHRRVLAGSLVAGLPVSVGVGDGRGTVVAAVSIVEYRLGACGFARRQSFDG